VNQNLQPGMHPDADQLSIFVEGAATGRERERMLAHLAECEECRDAVFLMQRPVETPPAAAKEASKEWVWQRWFLPVGLAGAALACGLTVVLVYVQPRTRAPESVRQNAEVQEPETGANRNTLVPSDNAGSAAQPKAKSGSGRGAVSMNAVRQGAGGATGSKAQNVETHAAAAVTATQSMETDIPSGSVGTMAEEGAAPKADAQPGVNSAVVQELPLNGRNVASLQSLAAPPGAQAATPRDSSGAQRGLPVLRVERPGGQDDTLSGVSGRVTDASGAVIPKATVALHDVSGSTRRTATGADGSFRLTGIPAGRYDLTVTAPGFRSNEQPIDLKPSELAMLQPVLNVGAATETVEVTSSGASLETESATVGAIPAELPSRFPVAASVSLGKRILSLDGAGSLFLSRNAGMSWKKINPQWTGKAVRIDLTTSDAREAKRKSKTSGAENRRSLFQLTTDAGAEWTSKDGTRWHSH
jgi:Carboxypeptidase regulatory-like domain/Putative zinc-finger